MGNKRIKNINNNFVGGLSNFDFKISAKAQIHRTIDKTVSVRSKIVIINLSLGNALKLFQKRREHLKTYRSSVDLVFSSII